MPRNVRNNPIASTMAAGAQHQVGEGSAQDDVHPCRQSAIEQGVGDHALGLGEHCRVVGQRITHQHQHQDDPPIGQDAFHRAQLAFLDGVAALLQGGVVAALEHARRQPQRQDRERDHDHADHIPQRVFQPHLRDAQIGLRGQHVGRAQHQWRAQVVEHFDEHKRCASHIPRQRQPEDHATEQAEPA
ncbi:hypothetical protein G6F57_019883 [Rhizopus arrhizus]|nr:hypothetical protein G6F57_019883 [Rhizopus arrhizus]